MSKAGRPLRIVYIFNAGKENIGSNTTTQIIKKFGMKRWKLHDAIHRGIEVKGHYFSYEEEIYSKHVAFVF